MRDNELIPSALSGVFIAVINEFPQAQEDEKQILLSNIIQNYGTLKEVLNSLPENNRFTFLNTLEENRRGFLADCIRGQEEFIYMYFFPNQENDFYKLLRASQKQFAITRIRTVLDAHLYREALIGKFNALFEQLARLEV